jgi:hypothetical protein
MSNDDDGGRDDDGWTLTFEKAKPHSLCCPRCKRLGEAAVWYVTCLETGARTDTAYFELKAGVEEATGEPFEGEM